MLGIGGKQWRAEGVKVNGFWSQDLSLTLHGTAIYADQARGGARGVNVGIYAIHQVYGYP